MIRRMVFTVKICFLPWESMKVLDSRCECCNRKCCWVINSVGCVGYRGDCLSLQSLKETVVHKSSSVFIPLWPPHRTVAQSFMSVLITPPLPPPSLTVSLAALTCTTLVCFFLLLLLRGSKEQPCFNFSLVLWEGDNPGTTVGLHVASL